MKRTIENNSKISNIRLIKFKMIKANKKDQMV